MSQNDRIIALLNAHYQGDDEQFNTVALQLAAAEARAGHAVVAQEIRKLIDKHRSTNRIVRMSFMNTALQDNEVGEMRRILNSFLKLIEQPLKRSIVVTATNDMKVLDNALFRRFDDVVQFALPTQTEVKTLLQKRLEKRVTAKAISDLTKSFDGYSQAVICAVCQDAIKTSILTNKPLTKQMVLDSLAERNSLTKVG